MMYKIIKNGFWYLGIRVNCMGYYNVPVWVVDSNDAMEFGSYNYATTRATELGGTVVEVTTGEFVHDEV